MLAPSHAFAQWVHYPAPGTPRTQDGKPNLDAQAPRGRDGKPDLSGIWAPEPTPILELLRLAPDPDNIVPAAAGSEPLNKYALNILADFKPGEAPLQPSAAIRRDEPGLRCLPTGMPMFDTIPVPRKIVQNPGLIVILSEYDQTFRQIFTGGRKFPEDLEPSWLGSSIGAWEGDTLVVDTVGLNARSSLDLTGHTHNGQIHIVERYRRISFGKMEVQLTLTDPGTFVKPVSVKFNLVLFPDTDLIESFCSENEKDHSHVQ